MPITVKHLKVSTVPDAGDDTLVEPSDWNADHQLIGLGTAAELNAGVPNGVATLDAGGKVPVSELPAAVLGALSYQGTWDASTNTPTLTSSVGTKGYYYVVSVAGNTNLNGITDWLVGDWAVYNGSIWQKVDNTETVTSVNGQVGAVVLTTTNIAEGTNEYFTTARARTSVSAGTGISYNSTTGVITNSSPSLGGDVVGPASATDNAVARYNLTTGKLIQNSVTLIDDTGNASGILSQQFSNGSAVTSAAGKIWYDGSAGSWNAGMGGGNITQQIGEELFVYGKASAAITDSPLQIIYQTGATGASGVIQFAPTIAGITDGTLILGVATENLALNGFGRITSYGVVRGITTNGTAFGETWVDGDEIYYNPVTGNPTKVKPVAPNIKVSVGTLIHAGAGGSGSIQVEINHGSVLGGTDANVQLTSVSNGQIISYDGGNGYWKNTDLTAGTGISISETVNGVLTVTNTLPSLGGTVTSVSGTAGRITSTGGTTPVIDLASGVATAGTTGSSSLIPVVTIDTYGRVTSITTAANPQGTVTSVTGTAPVVSSGGATPAISLAASYGDTQNPYASKTANNFLAAPNGSAGVPTFRAVVAADIPTLNQNTTGTASNVTGTVAVLNGGTGATTAANARTNLGATTVGGNFFTLTNPSAITFPRMNADNTVSALNAADFRTAIGAGTGAGTVTSVSGTGTVNGISLSGTVTSSGNLTLGGTLSNVSLATQVTGTLPFANGGTGETTRQNAMDALAGAVTSGQYLRGNGTDVVMSAIQVADVPTLNQNTTGTAANVTGTVAVANGGTGLTSLTVNRIPYGNGTSAYQSNANFTFDGTTASAPIQRASNGIVTNSKTIGTSFTIPATDNAMSAGPVTLSSGVTVTVSSGSRWVVS